MEEMLYYMDNFNHSCTEITNSIFENKKYTITKQQYSILKGFRKYIFQPGSSWNAHNPDLSFCTSMGS